MKNTRHIFLTMLIPGLLFIASCTSRQEAEDAAKNSPSPIEAAEQQPETHGLEKKEITTYVHPIKPVSAIRIPRHNTSISQQHRYY